MDKGKIHFKLGYYMGEIGQYKEAIDNYKEAIKYKSNLIEAYYNLGLIFAREKEYSEAIKNFQQVIHLQNNHVKAYFNLGLVYLEEKNYTLAIQSFESVLKYESHNKDGYYYLGLCYEIKKNIDNALHIYKLGIKENPDDILLSNNYGALLVKNKDYREAIDLFENLFAKNSQDPTVCFNLGLAFDLNNQKIEAGKMYQKAIDLQPDYYEASFNLAKLNEDSNNFNQA